MQKRMLQIIYINSFSIYFPTQNMITLKTNTSSIDICCGPHFLITCIMPPYHVDFQTSGISGEHSNANCEKKRIYCKKDT